MKRNKAHALRLAVALAFCAAMLARYPRAANGQSASSNAPQSARIVKTHFVVQVMTYQSIVVHSPSDFRNTHTFSFSPAIRDKMQKLFNAGPYQYGDNISVWYRSGTDVALKIKGKPSKTK